MNRNKEQIQYFSTEDDGTLIKIIVSAVVFHVVVVAILYGLHFIDTSKPAKEIPIFEMVQVDQVVRTAEAKPVPPEPETKVEKPVEKSTEPEPQVEEPVEKIEEPPVEQPVEPPVETPPEPEVAPVETQPEVPPEPKPEKELTPEAPKTEPPPEPPPKVEEKKPVEEKPVQKPKPVEKKVEKPVKKPVEKKKPEPKKKPKNDDDDFDIGDLNLKKSFELPSLKAVNPIDMDPLMQVFLERAKAKIMSNFNPPNGLTIDRDAKTTVQFTVERSGAITSVFLKRSSSNSAWDHLSMRAVKISKLPELPPTYKGSSLVLQFNFTPN